MTTQTSASRWNDLLEKITHSVGQGPEPLATLLEDLRDELAPMSPTQRVFSARWGQPLTPLRETLFNGTETRWLRWVGWLELHWTWLGREGVQRAATRGDLIRLETLRLSLGQEHEPRDPTAALEGLRRMLPHLKRLRRLELYGLGWLEEHLEPLGEILGRAPSGALALAIEGCGLTHTEQLRRLGSACEPLKITALRLEEATLSGDLGVGLSDPAFSTLEALELDDVAFEAPEAERWPTLPLKTLSLRDLENADALLATLHQSGSLRSLQELTMRQLEADDALLNPLGVALSESPLEALALEGLSLYSPDALMALLTPLSLKRLSLRDNIYDEYLLDSPFADLRGLRELDLRGNDLGDGGATALAEAAGLLSSLETLLISDEDLDGHLDVVRGSPFLTSAARSPE